MAGRPTKLKPEIADRILRALRLGAYFETCAAAGGISRDTLHEWVRTGNRLIERAEKLARKAKPAPSDPIALLSLKEQQLARFAKGWHEGLCDAELRDLTLIAKAAVGDVEHGIFPVWQAAAWRLERRYPEKWGRRRIEVTGADGAPVRAQVYLPSNNREEPDTDD